MPLTPNYDLPYPTLSSVADVPSDIEALAEEVDTQLGTLSTAISGKASTSHNHDGDYAIGVMSFDNNGASVNSAATNTRSAASAAQTITIVSGRKYLMNYSGWATAENASTDAVQYGLIELRNVTDNDTLDSLYVSFEGNQVSRRTSFAGTHVLAAGGTGSKQFALYVQRLTSTAGTRIDILGTALNITEIGA